MHLLLKERSIQGSSRVGIETVGQMVASTHPNINININSENTPTTVAQLVGDKRYELSNHLGNVLEVVSDRKLAEETAPGSQVVDYYSADVLSQSDYYPFGMQLAGRVDQGTNDYRYGFSGMEKDDEISGNNNSYDFGARLYNPRVGRWSKLDPKAATYPGHSPYCYVANSPMMFSDFNGEYIILVNGKVSKDTERGDVSYWSSKFVQRITKAFDDKHHDFYDGDKAKLPQARYDDGYKQAKADFEKIIGSLERDENGKIIESVNLVSHSRGGNWSAGFQDAWNELVSDEKYSEQFADGNGQIDLNLMLAPHQSGYIEVQESSTKVVTITHDYDPASDGAVSSEGKGVVINLETDNNHQAWEIMDTHTIDGFHFEAEKVGEYYLKFKEIGFDNVTQDMLNDFKKAVEDASKYLWDRDKGVYSNDN